MAYQTPLTVKTALDLIADKRLVLPAIQREFVWVSDPDRMAKLFDSLLRRYPIGTFLFWQVPAAQSRNFDFYEVMRDWHEKDRRHNPRLDLTAERDVTAVLDGQQRLTTLNIGLNGSLAQRTRYKRSTSIGAYPLRHLYLDLLFKPDEESDVEFRFAFLTEDQASTDTEAHWYPCRKIMEIPDGQLALFKYLQAHRLGDQERPIEVLSRLWNAVHIDGVISAFEEKGERLNRVLDIFVRVNSGGVVLSKSDLLLSMATAHFHDRDARQEVHNLVDELNSEGSGFSLSKDLVLKTGLSLSGNHDSSFKVENFTKASMALLENQWDNIADSLRVAVKLLASFGYSSENLPANSVVIPVAMFVHSRGYRQDLVDSQRREPVADRQLIRSWVIKTILMPGVWGSGLDGLLKGLDRAITQSQGAFPVGAIEAEMARRGKSLVFGEALIDELLDTPYKSARAFSILSLLYETVDTLSRFHIDHVFPRALAGSPQLKSAGVDSATADRIREEVERLPNLQLLHGPINVDKRAKLPAAWVRERFPDGRARQAWMSENDLLDLPASAMDFPAFFDSRRQLMKSRLLKALSAGSADNGRPLETFTTDSFTGNSIPEQASATALAPRLRPAVSEPEVPRRHRATFRESVSELLADGRLTLGQTLHTSYLGVRHECVVVMGGFVLGDSRFRSLSAAGAEVTGGVPVNGWQFWHTSDGIPVGILRRS